MRSHCRPRSTSTPPVVAGSASKWLFGSGGGSARAERKAGVTQRKAANVTIHVLYIRSHTRGIHVDRGQGVAAACDFATNVRQVHASINISDRHAQSRTTAVHHKKKNARREHDNAYGQTRLRQISLPASVPARHLYMLRGARAAGRN